MNVVLQVGDNIITRYPVRHHPGGVLLTASIGLRYQIRAKVKRQNLIKLKSTGWSMWSWTTLCRLFKLIQHYK